MKTLGELKVGDEFYRFNWEGGYIHSIHKHKIAIIQEMNNSIHIKWFDDDNDLHGRIITFDQYNSVKCTSAYCESICSDKEEVKRLLEYDIHRFMEQYNKNLEILNK